MRKDLAQPTAASDAEVTRRRLAAEIADVQSAIALVATGSANSVTIGGLRFGDEVARRFEADARSRGVRLEPILRPEDAGCDLVVRRLDD
jgi:hypothetical protein